MYIIKYKNEVYSEFMMCIYYYTQPVKNSRWLKWFHMIYVVFFITNLFYVCKIQQTLLSASTSEVPRVYLRRKSCSLPIQIPLNFGDDFQYYNVSSISMYNVSFGWWVQQCAHCTLPKVPPQPSVITKWGDILCTTIQLIGKGHHNPTLPTFFLHGFREMIDGHDC